MHVQVECEHCIVRSFRSVITGWLPQTNWGSSRTHPPATPHPVPPRASVRPLPRRQVVLQGVLEGPGVDRLRCLPLQADVHRRSQARQHLVPWLGRAWRWVRSFSVLRSLRSTSWLVVPDPGCLETSASWVSAAATLNVTATPRVLPFLRALLVARSRSSPRDDGLSV